ncbi:hypothetical protein Ddye_026726 [Dipteronia dyeriana]|uniref:Uncharacterized protein n=1 Tax=Dipteronia dyeriana TaxID=168575 RepID=A0AAD9TN91_9ROSI|nr:hypothetical protein Ddye_026726 [Dipteronia dyeriana]
MGREIVRRESPKKPGNRSRLWKREDVMHTLKNSTDSKPLKFPSLEVVNLAGCKRLVDFPSSLQHLNSLRYLSLHGCSNVTKFPLTSGNIEDLDLDLCGTAIQEVPLSIQSLTKLIELDLSYCTRLKHIPIGICKLKSLRILRLHGCSELEASPEILETMEFLEILELSGAAIKELPPSIEHLNGLQSLWLFGCENLKMIPSSICNLTSLESLNLCNFSKLDKLSNNLGLWESTKPSLITRLEKRSRLDSSESKGLTILPPLCSLTRLYLNNCNLMEIPEDIGCLSSLVWLILGRNKFESLPKSIKHLSKLEHLSVRECNMLRSWTELPVALKRDLKNHQLNSAFFLSGIEIPEWFTYQSPGSSINIPVLWQSLINRKYKGFAICVVFGIEEYRDCHDYLSVTVHCHFETCNDFVSFPSCIYFDEDPVFINSDHILLGCCSFSQFYSSSQNLEKLLAIAGDSGYVDISFEFQAEFPVKCCAVYPIYTEPIKMIGATIKDIGETSIRRSGRSVDNEEEVEPHPKRICT